MLIATGVSKGYSGQKVLSKIGLEVQKGEIFGFVGPNGAGKTTFIKCVAGIARPDAGIISVGGINPQQNPVKLRRQISYAPSETAMYDSMRVLDFLKFALHYYPNADLEKARQLLADFSLPEKKRVSQLSHGMKRKLLLTQAFCCGTSMLLLDEPMEGLDPEARRQVESMLLNFASNGGTVFFSSHDLASVERICNRVAFLRKGELIECSSVDKILDRVSEVVKELPEHRLRAAVNLEDVFSVLYGGAE